MKKLAFTVTDTTYFYNLDDIIKLIADSNYTRIRIVNNPILLTSKVINKYEFLLKKEYGFIRVSRSAIINPLHLTSITYNEILMSDGSHIVIPRRRRAQLFKELEEYIIFT